GRSIPSSSDRVVTLSHQKLFVYTLNVCAIKFDCQAITFMRKRVNIVLPDATLKVLDRVAGKGDRSRFISQAVLHYVQTQSAANRRERLKQGAVANTELDLERAEERFAVEQEAWQRLDRYERASETS